ncbi:MAG: AI-2E family transporter [Sphingomonas sp.]
MDVAGHDDPPGGDPVPGAAQVAPTAAPEVRSLLTVVVSVVVVAALFFARDVLIPITLALLLSFVLSPLVNLIRRTRLWRAPSVMLAVLVAIGVLGAAGTLMGQQAAELTQDAPRYATTITNKVRSVQAFATAELGHFTKILGRNEPRAERRQSRAQQLRAATAARPVPVEVHQPPATPIEMARSILEPVLAPLETTVIVLVVAIFVLMQKEDLRDRFIRLFGSNDLHRTTMAIDDAGRRLSRYFISQLCVNASFGAIIGLGLWLIGVPQPALWGILAGLLRFVPYIGSFIAAIAPIALAAAVDPGWGLVIWTALLFIVVEPVIGYVVEPLLYGHSTGLSPVSVVVAAIFWTWVWGPIGLILSTPLTLCLVVLGRHVKSLEFFDVLLGDRPALTPVESFYQRLLSGNVDGAHEHADELLDERPLIAYYDDVVVPGLRLAAEDVARGSLATDRARGIAKTMRAIVAELDDHRDNVTPGETVALPDWVRAPGSVVCLPARGAFDESVARMAAQLLERDGVGARLVPNLTSTRETIAALDFSAVRLLCLCVLDAGANPSALRTTIRRLRDRAPATPILVALASGAEGPQGDGTIFAATTLAGLTRAVAAHRDAPALAPAA